ncbi:MAG: ABC transporter substrate-binding protein [Bacteroidia bacterium]
MKDRSRTITFLTDFYPWDVLFHFSQESAPPHDLRAADMIIQGKRYLEAENYLPALKLFESAAARPFSQSTTAAVYLTGLCYFHIGQLEKAEEYFEIIAKEYPRSRYVEEALYHTALMFLFDDDERKQRTGVEYLLNLAESARDSSIAKDAEKHVRNFIFYEADLEVVEFLLKASPRKHELMFLEAYCHQLAERGEREKAISWYQDYQQVRGLDSYFLKQLLSGEPVVRYVEKDVIRLAMFLPLYLEKEEVWEKDSISEIPSRSLMALEFYEGFQIALDTYSAESKKNVFLKILDTYKDSATTADNLWILDQLQPDLIVGSIYNQQSEILSQWSETHWTPQMVPLSPSSSLVEGKSQVFLAHPTAVDHGITMAEYAWDSLRLNRVAVWTDQRAGTEMLADAFSIHFDTLGGETIRLPVDSIFSDSAKKQIYSYVRSLKFQQIDGVYIPILSNQEIAGLILSQISAMGVNVKVMGSPHWWKRYDNIDRELKESYQVAFTTSYMINKEDSAYQEYFRDYLRKYGFPPSQYNIQGYDLGMYVVQLLDNFNYQDGISLSSYIRNAPSYQGLHQNFYFQSQQSNKFVNIGVYKDGTVININRPRKLNLKDFYQNKIKD